MEKNPQRSSNHSCQSELEAETYPPQQKPLINYPTLAGLISQRGKGLCIKNTYFNISTNGHIS